MDCTCQLYNISAIPVVWKNILKEGFARNQCAPRGFSVNHSGKRYNIDNAGLSTKQICSFFVSRIFKPPVAQTKFNREFDIHKEDWSKIYSLPFRSCKEVKTKIFQYKINMDSLMTNVRLFKMKIVDDDSCSFCSNFPRQWCILCMIVNKLKRFGFNLKTGGKGILMI